MKKIAAAIPVKDEASFLIDCLEALDSQADAQLNYIVLLVNNSSDNSASLARSVKLRSPTFLHVIECILPPEQANAGTARRLAMNAAAGLVGPGGIVMTTDADALVDSDWVAANLAALAQGADAVAGWVELHPLDWGTIPHLLHENDARECAYDALCDEIHARLDYDAADPMPRHTQHSGASIAVTADAYARCGGVPSVASGEDRALIAALRRVDGRVRHAPEVHVTVSGRTVGRAVGGMADTIRRRLAQPDRFLDDRLEPAAECARRARYRAEVRRAYCNPTGNLPGLIPGLGLSRDVLLPMLDLPHFGMAWDAIEAAAPLLQRHRVAVADLPTQMEVAKAIIATLRIAPDCNRALYESGYSQAAPEQFDGRV